MLRATPRPRTVPWPADRPSRRPLTSADHNMRVKQQDIIEEGQQAIDEGPNREQQASLINEAVAQEQQAELNGATKVLTVRQPSASAGQDDLNG